MYSLLIKYFDVVVNDHDPSSIVCRKFSCVPFDDSKEDISSLFNIEHYILLDSEPSL